MIDSYVLLMLLFYWACWMIYIYIILLFFRARHEEQVHQGPSSPPPPPSSHRRGLPDVLGRLDQSSPAATPLPGGGAWPGSTQLLCRDLHEASPDPHQRSSVLSDGLHGRSRSRTGLQSSTTCQRLQTFDIECNFMTCFAVSYTCLIFFFFLPFFCSILIVIKFISISKNQNRCKVSRNWHITISPSYFISFFLFFAW